MQTPVTGADIGSTYPVNVVPLPIHTLPLFPPAITNFEPLDVPLVPNAIVPDDNAIYMVSPDTRSLLVGRLADRKVVSEIDVGDLPVWVAIMGEK